MRVPIVRRLGAVIVLFVLFPGGCATTELYRKSHVVLEAEADQVLLARDGTALCIPYRPADDAPAAAGYFTADVVLPGRLLAARPLEIARAKASENVLYIKKRNAGGPEKRGFDLLVPIRDAANGDMPEGCGRAGEDILTARSEPFPFQITSPRSKYPLPLKVIGTPFTVAYDIVTYPFALLLLAIAMMSGG